MRPVLTCFAAAVLALGITGAIQGSLSPATSGAAGMLFGLGLDGVVLLYMRYLEEREAGHPPAAACRRMGGTASAVVLAQVTTAATFLALLFIDFERPNRPRVDPIKRCLRGAGRADVPDRAPMSSMFPRS